MMARVTIPPPYEPTTRGCEGGCGASGARASAIASKAHSPPSHDQLVLSLPDIHCAGCISAVERALNDVPGVLSARVNLSRKRVLVTAKGVTAEDLIAALASAGHTAQELNPEVLQTADPEGRALLIRLGVAGFAMMNVMLLSVAVWSGAEDATRTLFHWISALIALPAIAFAARPFFANALRALRAWRLNMDVPISLAILLAAGMSLSETWIGGPDAWFDAALSLTFFLLIGRYLDHRTRRVARSAAADLTALESPRALRIAAAADGVAGETLDDPMRQPTTVVPIAELAKGDVIRLLPGSRSPVDGDVIAGQSELDRAILTGESLPQPAAPGTRISAGEMNLTGPLVIRVSAAGADTSLRRLADLVALAETGRTRYTPLTDRAAAIYAPAVHLVAAAGFLGWYLATGDLRLALNVAVATLIITCPCALGLAVPAVSTAASGRLFRMGLLVKDPTALERLAEIDSVVFDKTGTLTEDQPRFITHSQVTQVGGPPDALTAPAPSAPDQPTSDHPTSAHPTSDRPGPEDSVALALAEGSGHPLARALSKGLRDRNLGPASVTHLTEVPGHGIEGRWNGRSVRLGRAEWVDAYATNLEWQVPARGSSNDKGATSAPLAPADKPEQTDAAASDGAIPDRPAAKASEGLRRADKDAAQTLPLSTGPNRQLPGPILSSAATWLRIGNEPPVPYFFDDSLRPGARRMVAGFAAQDLDLTLLSGDAERPVADVARRLGIPRWRAGLLPRQKELFMAGIRARGLRALMVGDGLNDTAAMARAHVSIAPASAPDAARTVSDIVLLGRDLAPLSEAYATAKSARSRILENFAIAAGYNAIAVPLALAGLASPLTAALAMSSSSILVSLNAMRLR